MVERWPVGYLHGVDEKFNFRLPYTENPDSSKVVDFNQGHADLKSSALNQSATTHIKYRPRSQGLSSYRPWGAVASGDGKRRDPGNEVDKI